MFPVLAAGSSRFKVSWRSAVFSTRQSKERPLVKKQPLLQRENARFEGMVERSWNFAPCFRGRIPEESPGGAVVKVRSSDSGDLVYWGGQDHELTAQDSSSWGEVGLELLHKLPVLQIPEPKRWSYPSLSKLRTPSENPKCKTLKYSI